MDDLLRLLKDGHARTIPMLAKELHTSTADVSRKIEYPVNMGLIRKVDFGPKKCGSCGGSCSSENGQKTCKSCMPEGGFQNMGQMWEVVG